MKSKKCNVCQKDRPLWWYKTPNKKTCGKCEYNPWRRFLRTLVRDRKLTAGERMASRIGYMGAGFLMAGQWTVEPVLFIIGFICVLVQVFSRRQWNLVALQLNGLIAWTLHFIKTLGQ